MINKVELIRLDMVNSYFSTGGIALAAPRWVKGGHDLLTWKKKKIFI